MASWMPSRVEMPNGAFAPVIERYAPIGMSEAGFGFAGRIGLPNRVSVGFCFGGGLGVSALPSPTQQANATSATSGLLTEGYNVMSPGVVSFLVNVIDIVVEDAAH